MPDFKFPKSSQYNFGKNLVKKYRLVPHLDQYFSKEVTGLQFTLVGKESDDAWHPSGDCTPSPTDLYHMALDRLAGTTEKSFNKAFPVGHFWHALCQKAVLDLGFATPQAIERKGIRGWGKGELKIDPTNGGQIMVSPGVPWHTFEPFHWCTGAADVAPLEIPGSEPLVVDFKTMNSRAYGKADSPLSSYVADKYEAQINIYMDFFDIDVGIILCIQKDGPHDMKEFEFHRNQPLIDAIYEKWEFVGECLEAKSEPTQLDDDCFNIDNLIEGPVST